MFQTLNISGFRSQSSSGSSNKTPVPDISAEEMNVKVQVRYLISFRIHILLSAPRIQANPMARPILEFRCMPQIVQYVGRQLLKSFDCSVICMAIRY